MATYRVVDNCWNLQMRQPQREGAIYYPIRILMRFSIPFHPGNLMVAWGSSAIVTSLCQWILEMQASTERMAPMGGYSSKFKHPLCFGQPNASYVHFHERLLNYDELIFLFNVERAINDGYSFKNGYGKLVVWYHQHCTDS